MAKLAIKGHKTRGKEVIALLEMLGGINVDNLYGDDTYYYYYITDDEEIDAVVFKYSDDEACIFSLEEFLEKFPYKIGYQVRVPEYESEVRISEMYWDGSEVQYEVITDETEWYSAKELNEFNEPYKEETMEEEGVYFDNEINCYHQDFGDKVRIRLGGDFEIKVEDHKTYIVKKKPHYQKTYEECCKIMQVARPVIWFDYNDVSSISEEGDEYERHLESTLCAFRELLICRDAYWKIAGKEMGLGKPWKPYWTIYEHKFCLGTDKDKVIKECVTTGNRILAFPTAEMRDAFYENFKELIEQCNELL